MSKLRFVERFLIVFAALALCIKIAGAADGATLLLLAFPLLQAFYLLATPIYFWQSARGRKNRMPSLGMGIFTGLALCYSLISLMLVFLKWLPVWDMVENCGLLLGFLLLLLFWHHRKTKMVISREFLIKSSVFLIGILAAALLLK